jgi:hypothetical protein
MLLCRGKGFTDRSFGRPQALASVLHSLSELYGDLSRHLHLEIASGERHLLLCIRSYCLRSLSFCIPDLQQALQPRASELLKANGFGFIGRRSNHFRHSDTHKSVSWAVVKLYAAQKTSLPQLTIESKSKRKIDCANNRSSAKAPWRQQKQNCWCQSLLQRGEWVWRAEWRRREVQAMEHDVVKKANKPLPPNKSLG